MGSGELDLSPNAERFSGFADLYDDVRPTPPADLAVMLCEYARVDRPALVVDLGSGSGLSTRWAAGWAEHVVGVEPNADMRLAATRAGTTNMEFVNGLSHQTGLPDGCADIVMAVQSLHWMEPESTFAEVARVLRPDGAFAAIDCDWPPLIGDAQSEAEWDRCHARARRGEDALAAGLRGDALLHSLDIDPDAVDSTLHGWDAGEHRRVAVGVHRWGKDTHLDRMRASGKFTISRELGLHTTELGDADRFVDLLRSQGGVQSLLAHGITEEQLGILALHDTCEAAIGTGAHPMRFSYRARIGLT